MLWQWLYCVILGICFVLLWFIFHYVRNVISIRKKLKEVPGNGSSSLFKNVLMLLQCRTKEKLFNFLREMNKSNGDIWKLQLLHHGTVSFSNPEDIKLVLSSTAHLDKGDVYRSLQPWLCFGLLTSTGDKWHNRRKILTPAFHFNILLQFLPIFIEHTDNLIKNLQKECCKDATDVTPFIIDTTLQSICETTMGTKLDPKNKAQKEYVNAIHRFGVIIVQRILSPWMHIDWIYKNLIPLGRQQQKITDILHKFSMGVIKERQSNFVAVNFQENHFDVFKSKKRLAMLDLLISAKTEGEDIDDEGIREEVDTFMFEGHDTTSMCICFTLMLIANHPEIQDKLMKEIEEVMGKDWPPTYNNLQELQFMERCIKESLRLYPSVPYISRQINEDLKTATGFLLPAGCMIHIMIYDLHRNPQIYAEPTKYDPDRFLPEAIKDRHPYAFIPFSAGPRNCIGQKFAYLEIKTILTGILRKFVLKPVDTPHSMEMGEDFILRSKNGIKLQLSPRTND